MIDLKKNKNFNLLKCIMSQKVEKILKNENLHEIQIQRGFRRSKKKLTFTLSRTNYLDFHGQRKENNRKPLNKAGFPKDYVSSV